eukprot:scaffold199999_cov19-Tisochrysis_lutea.AAC.1
MHALFKGQEVGKFALPPSKQVFLAQLICCTGGGFTSCARRSMKPRCVYGSRQGGVAVSCKMPASGSWGSISGTTTCRQSMYMCVSVCVCVSKLQIKCCSVVNAPSINIKGQHSKLAKTFSTHCRRFLYSSQDILLACCQTCLA